MSTTNLFVELVVIGIGVLLWVAMLVVGFFGPDWLPLEEAILLISAVPALAVVYVFGVIWDRVADYVFDRLWSEGIRSRYYSDIGAYYHDRRIILTQSQALSELLEYGRSRLRICRGWMLNAVAFAISLSFVTWAPFSKLDVAASGWILGLVICAAIAFGSWFGWKSLTAAEYRKIKQQATYLTES